MSVPGRVGPSDWFVADLILRRRAAVVLEKSAIAHLLGERRTIVDLGCGTGHVGEAVLGAAPGSRLIMVDPAWRPSRRLCRRLDTAAPGRWQHIAAEAQELPLGPGTADLVLLAFVLHHVGWSVQARILAEARRILRPGGQLVLIEDTPQGPEQTRRTVLADRLLNGEILPGLHNYRTAADWSAELAAAGFRLREQRGFSGLPPRVTFRPVLHSCLVGEKICERPAKTAQARP